jgi:hypothetical protein
MFPCMASFCRITIRAHGHLRTVTSQSEREAALMAESILRQFTGNVMSVGYWVDCSDTGAIQRIAHYLDDLTAELA